MPQNSRQQKCRLLPSLAIRSLFSEVSCCKCDCNISHCNNCTIAVPCGFFMVALNRTRQLFWWTPLAWYFKSYLSSSITRILTIRLLFAHFVTVCWKHNKLFPQQFAVKRDTAIASAIVLAALLYFTKLAGDSDTSLFYLGLLCNVFTILFFASPLSTLVSTT